MQFKNSLVFRISRNLRNSYIVRAQRFEGIDKIALVKALKRARDHRTTLDIQPLDALLVVRDSERVWHVTVILLQRVRRIDDVQVGIKYFVGH